MCTVETIKSTNKKPQETHIVKSDGSTEKTKGGRTLTSQEESILLPLIQGLLAANNANESMKHENTPLRDREPTSNNAKNNNKSNLNAEHSQISKQMKFNCFKYYALL